MAVVKKGKKERLGINLDSELKNEVGSLLDELGLDYITAITIYFKQTAKRKKIPFEISTTNYRWERLERKGRECRGRVGMNCEVRLTDLSAKDFKKLDNSQKKHILKSFLKIEQHGMQTGQQLSGKLKYCRKLKHKRLGLWVIFKESVFGIEIIEIVVIGKRADSEVYEIVEKRLGR